MDEFVNSQKYGNEEIQKGTDGTGNMEGVHHVHTICHGPNCEVMGEQHDAKSPKEDDEKDMENEGEHGSLPNEDMKDEEKGEHKGAYPGFIRKIR